MYQKYQAVLLATRRATLASQTTRWRTRSMNALSALKHFSQRPLVLRRNVSLMASVPGKIDAREQPGSEGYASRWQETWAAGVEKGQAWDRSKSSPALLELLTSGRLDARGKRVLVPGCGRGYDVATFAAEGGAACAVGLEISSSAVQEATLHLKEALGESSNASVELGNFFTWQHADGAFDFGLDYTFFCAMHPNDRLNWAEGWAKALKTGATLITLIYPVDPSMDPNVGPPFPVTPDLYKDVLIPAGFELSSLEAISEQQSHEGRGGREFLGLWRRI